MFGTRQAVEAGKKLIKLRKDYSNPPTSERGLDPLMYAYLSAAYSKVRVSRQEFVYFTKSKKPSRIDFRIGGPNPAVIEFAVRPRAGQQQLQGPQNHSELVKLSKVSATKAKRRILLLVDLKAKAIGKNILKLTYDRLHAGKGKKQRHPVTVVYVHQLADFWFSLGTRIRIIPENAGS